MTISARTTIYAGIQMRSRLEASFAEHLDNAGVKQWGYEGDAYASSQGQYLPDFTTGLLDLPEILRWTLLDGGDAMKLRKHVSVLSGYVASQDRERGSVVSADRSPPDGEKVGGPGNSARGEVS